MRISTVSEKPEQQVLKSAKNIVLGKDRPPILTQILLLVALMCFCYYFFWNGLRIVALNYVSNLEDGGDAQGVINALGAKFSIDEPIKAFKLYGMGMMASWGAALLGMAFVWRRKVWAYYIFFLGMLAAFLCPIIFLSLKYFMGGIDWVDYVIPPVLIGLFYLSMMRLRKLKEKAEMAKLA